MSHTQIIVVVCLLIVILGLGWAPPHALASNLRIGLQIGLGILAALLLARIFLGHLFIIKADAGGHRAPHGTYITFLV